MRAALAARARLERLLEPHAFAGDDGSADPAVTAALTAHEAALAQGPRQARAAMVEVVRALTASRLIVPVAAHALPTGTGPVGARRPGVATGPAHEVRTADPCQDAATLAVDLPDGHRALPVFTSAGALASWRADVRPVPVDHVRAAQVACLATDQLWVLDPGTRDLRVPRPAVVALATGGTWTPSWEDAGVEADLRERLGAVPGVLDVAVEAGESAELRVYAMVDRSRGRTELVDAVDGCQRVLVDPAWGERIDTVELCPVPWPPEDLA